MRVQVPPSAPEDSAGAGREISPILWSKMYSFGKVSKITLRAETGSYPQISLLLAAPRARGGKPPSSPLPLNLLAAPMRAAPIAAILWSRLPRPWPILESRDIWDSRDIGFHEDVCDGFGPLRTHVGRSA